MNIICLLLFCALKTIFAEVLPLVEFVISDDISLEEARHLISAEPPLGQSKNPLQEQVSIKKFVCL